MGISVHPNHSISVAGRGYNLCAVVCHSGAAAKVGHYYTLARHRSTEGKDIWWVYNDPMRRVATQDEAHEFRFIGVNHHMSTLPYTSKKACRQQMRLSPCRRRHPCTPRIAATTADRWTPRSWLTELTPNYKCSPHTKLRRRAVQSRSLSSFITTTV